MAAESTTIAALLARQAGAYGELIGEDLREAGRACRSRLWVGGALATAAVFLIEMVCFWLIALAWDTPGRLWAIGALAGFFLLAVILGALAWRRLAARPLSFLSATRYEWRKDRELLEDYAASSSGGAVR